MLTEDLPIVGCPQVQNCGIPTLSEDKWAFCRLPGFLKKYSVGKESRFLRRGRQKGVSKERKVLWRVWLGIFLVAIVLQGSAGPGFTLRAGTVTHMGGKCKRPDTPGLPTRSPAGIGSYATGRG